MKTYRDDKLDIQLDVPEEWSLPKFGPTHTPEGESLVFLCSYFEAFNIQIGPSSPELSLAQTEVLFRQYVQSHNWSSLEFGRIVVEGKEHVCARYYLGRGMWSRKYLIVLSGIEYAITASCYYGDMLAEREKVWDSVVKSLRLLSQPASKDERGSATQQKVPSKIGFAFPDLPPEPAAPASLNIGRPQRVQTLGNGLLQQRKTVILTNARLQQSTFVFSIISYILVLMLTMGFLTIKVGLLDFFSLTAKFHSPLTRPGYALVFAVMAFGIGALICLIFVLGVVVNTTILKNGSPFFRFVELTMRTQDKETGTFAMLVFSDNMRKPRNLADGSRLQIISLALGLLKIISLVLNVVTLPPLLLLLFGILLIAPGTVLRLELPLWYYAMILFTLFFSCYRAFLFRTAKSRKIALPGDQPTSPLEISTPSIVASIASLPATGVTPHLIEEILSQEAVIRAIKSDISRTDQVGYRETWRLGLITPDQDLFDITSYRQSRGERMKRFIQDAPSRYVYLDQIRYKRSAVLYSTSFFSAHFNNVLINAGLYKRIGYPGWSYSLSGRMHPGEYSRIRDIQIARSTFTENRSRTLPQFLQEDGFPLRDVYADGDPLTTDRTGTIVIDQGRLLVIHPRYFIQRRIIDDEGNLVDIGFDENLGHTVMGVEMKPAVSRWLVREVSSHRYLPLVRYRTIPYSSEYMLPVLDTPMSMNGWADLFIDPQGKARLYIARPRSLDQWYGMMNRLRQLFYDELAKKDYHLLGLTKDKAQLNHYLCQKHAILGEFFIIHDLQLS